MARRPVDASISGTLVTDEPTALSLPDTEDDPSEEVDEVLPDVDTLDEYDPPPDEYDPPELLDWPLGRLERPPMASTAAEDIAKAVTVVSAVAANLNTVTVRSLISKFLPNGTPPSTTKQITRNSIPLLTTLEIFLLFRQ